MTATKQDLEPVATQQTTVVGREHAAPQLDISANGRDNQLAVAALAGGALALYGLTRRDGTGLTLALLGGGLAYGGLSGRLPAYETLANMTGNPALRHPGRMQVERSVTINKPAAELFAYWRNFENLPRFMEHLKDVRVLDNTRSHWVAKAPLGTSVEWDAAIFRELPDEMISWHSLEGADVPNAGSVRFKQAPAGRGTEVKVTITYDPPLGVVGSTVAWLLGEEPTNQVSDSLRRFKQIMEAGAVPTVDGQSSGRK